MQTDGKYARWEPEKRGSFGVWNNTRLRAGLPGKVAGRDWDCVRDARGASEGVYGDELMSRHGGVQRVPQRPAESFEVDLHDVAILELQLVSEREGVSAEKMDVDIARAAVGFKLEMMVLDIPQ